MKISQRRFTLLLLLLIFVFIRVEANSELKIQTARQEIINIFADFNCSNTIEQFGNSNEITTDKALLALDAFLFKYYNNSKQYLMRYYPRDKLDSEVSQYWNFAQCWDALIDGVILTQCSIKNMEKLLTMKEFKNELTKELQNKIAIRQEQQIILVDLISAFYQGQENIGWDRDYYDDMNWMTIALLRSYLVVTHLQTQPNYLLAKEQLKNEKLKSMNTQLIEEIEEVEQEIEVDPSEYLNQAELLFEQVSGAWDESCCGTGKQVGGVWWDTDHSQKAAASNLGPIIAACGMWAVGGNRTALNWAREVWEWWGVIHGASMWNLFTGQVADHEEAPSGDIVWWAFTYNQGLFIGSGVLLHILDDVFFEFDKLSCAISHKDNLNNDYNYNYNEDKIGAAYREKDMKWSWDQSKDKFEFSQDFHFDKEIEKKCERKSNVTYGTLENAKLAANYLINNLSVNGTISVFNSTTQSWQNKTGPILYDGSSCTSTDCPQFKGIGYRWLWWLNQYAPQPDYQNALNVNVISLWQNAQKCLGYNYEGKCDEYSLAFGTNWQGPPPLQLDVLNNAQESAACIALCVAARSLF